MIELLTPVKVAVPTDDRVIPVPGVVIGRAICEPPRYDVQLIGGPLLNNVEAVRVRVAA